MQVFKHACNQYCVSLYDIYWEKVFYQWILYSVDVMERILPISYCYAFVSNLPNDGEKIYRNMY
jgi:hypothetical protein